MTQSTVTAATTAMVFPGQGSQAVGMLADLAQRLPVVRDTFQEASDVLGLDLWRLAQEGPEGQLNATQNTQPAMLAAGVAVWRAWRAEGGLLPAVMAGHSLGEYTALVCAGALQFATAVQVVADRGRFMQEAVAEGEGAMAAILGLEDAQVIDLCREAAGNEVVAAVNFNSPGQVVVAGNAAAVARAIDLAKAAGAKRALPLPVSVPSHCVLMRPAADNLRMVLKDVAIQSPSIPVIHNVDCSEHRGADEIREALIGQLYSPVRWVESVQRMAGRGVRTVIEAGPGKVLAGLIKRIDRELEVLPVFDPETLAKALDRVRA